MSERAKLAALYVLRINGTPAGVVGGGPKSNSPVDPPSASHRFPFVCGETARIFWPMYVENSHLAPVGSISAKYSSPVLLGWSAPTSGSAMLLVLPATHTPPCGVIAIAETALTAHVSVPPRYVE
jgi:hypothetical protein